MGKLYYFGLRLEHHKHIENILKLLPTLLLIVTEATVCTPSIASSNKLISLSRIGSLICQLSKEKYC
jgi:hypothetical protein